MSPRPQQTDAGANVSEISFADSVISFYEAVKALDHVNVSGFGRDNNGAVHLNDAAMVYVANR